MEESRGWRNHGVKEWRGGGIAGWGNGGGGEITGVEEWWRWRKPPENGGGISGVKESQGYRNRGGGGIVGESRGWGNRGGITVQVQYLII